jgi:RNA polymerase sigma-70 factor (ECF subfamily)
LLAFAQRLTGDADSARDVVQETFLALCKQRREDVEPRLAEWLYSVARNEAMDVVRKDGRMQAEDVDDVERASADSSPAAVLEVREDGSRVLAMLAGLPAKQREVLRLKFQSGLSYKEIASITGTSIGNVGFLVHVGLKSLRERLASRGARVEPRSVEGQVS